MHTCLGIQFDFSVMGQVNISMLDCIMELIKGFPGTTIKCKETLAQDWLFKVREDGQENPLPQEKTENFHTFEAKLLLLCNRERPDTQTAAAFLTTQVRKLDQAYWKKLKRVIECLKNRKT